MGFLVSGNEYNISMTLKFENEQTPLIKTFNTNMIKSQKFTGKINILPLLNQ